ncbi:MAG: malonate decarboxylase holo-[acyl-carrier-protein] synthase [Rhodocyclales bacterium GT-UBC]|nr:MAG: malonate decarboxylase holo-[acyl-carrier-protein] synthase [Rhodocyclales bacterium GT-UBC]
MRRHDLVWLRPGAAFTTPCAESGSAAWSALADWLAAGRPLVAARQATPAGPLLLGLGLPLRLGRQRLSVQVDAAEVAEVCPPLTVGACLARVPAEQAAVLSALAEQVEACGARLGIYGSLAWEALSGEAYRHAGSDIDLICDVADRAQYGVVIEALRLAAIDFPGRLDGELRVPDGRAVAWQEILRLGCNLARPVLVKGERDVCLQPWEAVLAGLQPLLQVA